MKKYNIQSRKLFAKNENRRIKQKLQCLVKQGAENLSQQEHREITVVHAVLLAKWIVQIGLDSRIGLSLTK